jgi:hypothetical protein
MRDMKMRGFFMHARGGLETEYLSDEWFNAINICLDEAKKYGMEAWSYDENGWPSGFCGGKLLTDPNNHAVYLLHSFTEAYPDGDDVVGVYSFVNGKPVLITKDAKKDAPYLVVRIIKDPTYVDNLRYDVVKKFIDSTHAEYRERIGSEFGKTMPGFFTDEPRLYWKTPYSLHMEKWFFDEYGYSVKDALPSLFCDYEGAKEHRYNYQRLLNKKFTESYSKQIYDWAEKNQVQITGHFIEEVNLRGQMMGCCGIMEQYRYMHIPGMDHLGREVENDVAPKQLGSIASQLGKKRVLAEIFAGCGWNVSPKELKRIAERQYVSGINITCQHLYPYSIRGERKRDFPAFYSEHNLWQRDLPEFNRYFNNLGCMLAMGNEVADTLVVHPLHSAWLTYQRINSASSVKDLDDAFERLVKLLSDNQITYHFGDENIMAEFGEVIRGKLRIGKHDYSRVIVSACDTLDSATVNLLTEFKQSGGEIFTYSHHVPTRIDGRIANIEVLNDCCDICDDGILENIRLREEIALEGEKCGLRIMVRKTELGRLIYIVNLSGYDVYNLKVIAQRCKNLGRLDISTLKVSTLEGRSTESGCEANLSLHDGEAAMLFEHGAPNFKCRALRKDRYIQFTEEFKLDKINNNYLLLDRARIAYDGELSELMPIERIRDELLHARFKGTLNLVFPFYIKDIPTRLEAIIEPKRVMRIAINDIDIELSSEWAIDRSLRTVDVSKYLRNGENSIELTFDYYQREYVYEVLYGGASETLRNSLVFDTEIENIYLRGRFALDMKKEAFTEDEDCAYRYNADDGMALIKQKDLVDVTNLVAAGYPFYCGEFTVSTSIVYNIGDPTVLKLSGNYSVARVSVNGKFVGNSIFSDCIELSSFLQTGKNIISITLCNGYRNLLGPHHWEIAEPLGVGPINFSFEKKWIDGKCKEYDSRYSFVKYGIDIKKGE